MNLGLMDPAFVGSLGGTGLWTPAQISTALWLDASDSSTLFAANTGSTLATAGGTVGRWADKSGNNRHATQETSGSRPTLTANGLDSKNVITFSNGPFLNSSSVVMNGDNWTAVAVFSLSSGMSANYGRLLSAAKTGAVDWTDANSWAIMSRRLGATIGTEYNSTPNAVGVSYNTPLLFVVTRSLASGTGFLNGTQVISRGPSPSGLDTTGGARIGRSLNPGLESSENWAGYAAEIILLQGMTTTTRQQLEGYLAHKWSLTANLPADHPYKTIAP